MPGQGATAGAWGRETVLNVGLLSPRSGRFILRVRLLLLSGALQADGDDGPVAPIGLCVCGREGGGEAGQGGRQAWDELSGAVRDSLFLFPCFCFLVALFPCFSFLVSFCFLELIGAVRESYFCFLGVIVLCHPNIPVSFLIRPGFDY